MSSVSMGVMRLIGISVIVVMVMLSVCLRRCCLFLQVGICIWMRGRFLIGVKEMCGLVIFVSWFDSMSLVVVFLSCQFSCFMNFGLFLGWFVMMIVLVLILVVIDDMEFMFFRIGNFVLLIMMLWVLLLRSVVLIIWQLEVLIGCSVWIMYFMLFLLLMMRVWEVNFFWECCVCS